MNDQLKPGDKLVVLDAQHPNESGGTGTIRADFESDAAPQRGVDDVVNAVRRLALFMGGTGKAAALKFARGLQDRGIKCGEIDPQTGMIVDMVYVDSNEKDMGENNEDVNFLESMGAKVVPLYEHQQHLLFQRAGVYKYSTPGMPDEADMKGCKGDRRIGGALLALHLVGPKMDAKGRLRNLRELLKNLITDWKRVTAPGVTNIYIDGIGGDAGGTGPNQLLLTAVAIQEAKRIFGSTTAVQAALHTMSGESFELDPNMDHGEDTERKIATFMARMDMLAAAFNNGVRLPTGEFIPHVPGKFFTVHGQSDMKAIPRGGSYAPAEVIAHYLLHQMSQDGNNVAGSALSNKHGHAVNERRVKKDGDRFEDMVDSHIFGSYGVASAVPETSTAALLTKKKAALLEAVAGLSTNLTVEAQEAIGTAQGLILPNDKLAQLQAAVRPPLVNEDNIMVTGEEESAGSNAAKALRTLIDKHLPRLDENARENAERAISEMSGLVIMYVENLKRHHGLMAVKQFLAALDNQLTRLEDLCRQQKTPQVTDITSKIEGLKGRSLPGKFFRKINGRDKALAGLRDDVGGVVSSINSFTAAKRDEAVAKAILQALPKLKAALGTAKQANHATLGEATALLDNIPQPQTAATDLRTAFDLSIPIREFKFKENPAALRAGLPDLGTSSLTTMLARITLTEADVRDIALAEQITLHQAQKLAQHARPLTMNSMIAGVDDDRETMDFPYCFVPKTSGAFTKEGQLVGRLKINTPIGFTPIPSRDMQVTAITEVHGERIGNSKYDLEGFLALMRLPPSQRKSKFRLEGEIEEYLPAMAKYFAELMEMADPSGKVRTCGGCDLKVYHRDGDESDCCEGCAKVKK